MTFSPMVKFRHITQIPICANYMLFERARRAESNDTKIKDRSKLWVEIQVPEFQKRGGEVSSFLGVKNSNIQMIVHSKELIELS